MKPFDKEKNKWYTLLQISKKAMKRRVGSGVVNREPWYAEKGKWIVSNSFKRMNLQKLLKMVLELRTEGNNIFMIP
jgi:hypothetical protein